MADFGFDPHLSAREMRKIKYYERMFAKLDSEEQVKRQNSEDKSKTFNCFKSWSDDSSKSPLPTSVIPGDTRDNAIKSEPAAPASNINTTYTEKNWDSFYIQSTNNSLEDKWIKSNSKKKSRGNNKRENVVKDQSTDIMFEKIDSSEINYNYSVSDVKTEILGDDYQKVEHYEIPEKIQKLDDYPTSDSRYTTTIHEDAPYISSSFLANNKAFQLNVDEANIVHRTSFTGCIDNTNTNSEKEQVNYSNFTIKKCDSMLNICPKLEISLSSLNSSQPSIPNSEEYDDVILENNLDPRGIFSYSYALGLPDDPRKLSFTSNLMDRLKSMAPTT